MAFFKGDERTRSFRAITTDSGGDKNIYSFTTSGETDGFESFELNTDETVQLVIKADDPNKYDWLSIFEVGRCARSTRRFFVFRNPCVAEHAALAVCIISIAVDAQYWVCSSSTHTSIPQEIASL